MLSLKAPSIFAVPMTIHGEGHPSLWYLLLRVAHDLFGTKIVLPMVSAAIGGLSVILFLWRSPFPLWWKALFIFTGLPLYEYTVMARNYGISMLLMFLYAIAYTSTNKSPLLLGTILFLLANTNLHSAALVPIFIFIWCWDLAMGREGVGLAWRNSASVVVGILLALCGVLVCLLTIYPSNHDLYATRFLDRSLFHNVASAVATPGQYFRGLLIPIPVHRGVLLTTALLYLGVFGLISRLPLFFAALFCLWGHAFFFAQIYPGGYRHQGIFLVFLITLYWIGLAKTEVFPLERTFRKALPIGLRFVLPIFLVMGIGVGCWQTYLDIVYDRSESKTLGKLLRNSPDFHEAIVVAEPDYALMALPYYANNDTYLLRESRYGNSVVFTRSAKLDLNLSDILDTSRRLRAQSGKRIIILLGHRLEECEVDGMLITLSYAWQFRCTRKQLQEFQTATIHLASLQGALVKDENFEVYALR